MSDLPLVTIGTLNYNNGRFVIESLESYRAQTYQNIELIIVDDCSTDGSLQMIKDWLKTYDRPYKLIEHPVNKGVLIGVKEVYEYANGKYLSLSATDDALVPEKTAEQVAVLEKLGDEYAVAYGDCEIIDEQSNPIGLRIYEQMRGKDFIAPSGDVFREVSKTLYFMTLAALINLPLLKKTGFVYNADNQAEDWDIQMCLARNYKFHGSNKIYALYRNVTNSISKDIYISGKRHVGYKSILNIFFRYYKHPLNDEGDRTVIRTTATNFFWLLVSYPLCTVKERLEYAWRMLKIAPKPKFFIFLLKSVILYVFGIKPKSQTAMAGNAKV